MQHRDDHRPGERDAVEPCGDVDRDDEQRDDDGEDRRVRDLPPEARRHVLRAELLRVHLALQERGQLGLLGGRQLLQADLEALVPVAVRRFAAPLDDRVAAADRRRLGAHGCQRGRGLRGEGDLHAAFEVDAEVQATDAE